MRVDIHQHFWSEPLVSALARRHSLPFVRRADGLSMLHCAGEQPCVIDLEAEEPGRRAALLRSDGLDLALIAISSPIGIEALPDRDARELIAAHLQGVGSLGLEFAAWGPVPVEQPAAGDVDELLAQGCLGISLPAGALAGPEALYAAGPVLERIAAQRAPLFVHPGPGLGHHPRAASLSEPLWWTALTSYVAQMQAAWLTYVSYGRREHPDLVVVFAMLAGGAPLLSERLAARGGPPIDLRDPLVFYETSSYGPAAVEALDRRVGPDQLVYGSDRPVVEPTQTGRETILKQNGARLLTLDRIAA